MKCPRCHNEDNAYFFKLNNEVYCRKCIQFSRVNINEERKTVYLVKESSETTYHLDFELSSRQKEISMTLVENYKNKVNSYVWAVCGSGKTEIVFEVIRYALAQGHRVCFAIPRKELVKELYERIKESFKDADIGLLYGGCIENQDAQFIICTMHQLYRFENDIGFDLMIADEVDAFPFYGNVVLQEIFQRCTLGSFIQLSATFIDSDIKDGHLLIMNRRYHGVKLPVPQQYLIPLFIQKYIVLYFILSKKRRWIIYVPSLSKGEEIYRFIYQSFQNVDFISSKTLDNQKKINRLKDNEHYVLISTTLLERGITIEDVHVIVYEGEHRVFDERTLIQISGRVGRKPKHPTGDIIILSSYRTSSITKCIQTIKRLNEMNV